MSGAAGAEGEDRRREGMLQHLVCTFIREGYTVKGVKGLEGFGTPSAIRNRGFGSRREHIPDVVGIDSIKKRIVFGLVRADRKSLDTEEALEEYNVFLDHNEGLQTQASLLLVLFPAVFLAEFTAMITHYVHREYWHRIVPVPYEPEEEKEGSS